MTPTDAEVEALADHLAMMIIPPSKAMDDYAWLRAAARVALCFDLKRAKTQRCDGSAKLYYNGAGPTPQHAGVRYEACPGCANCKPAATEPRNADGHTLSELRAMYPLKERVEIVVNLDPLVEAVRQAIKSLVGR